MSSILDSSIELRHLLYFRAVAEAGGFTRAAAMIGLRQPTLSHQIRQLETTLGVELFHRSRRECRLTAAGEMLLPYARRVLAEMDALKRSLDEMSELKRGNLSVGVLPGLLRKILPVALATFHQAYPGVRVRVVELSMDDMERELQRGKLELGLGVIPTAQGGLKGQALFVEDLVAVVTSKDALAANAEVSVAALAERALALPPPGYGTRVLLMNAFAKTKRVPRVTFEATAQGLLPRLVRTGGQVAIVPASTLGGEVPEGCRVLRIVKPALRRQIGLITPQGTPSSPAIDAFTPGLLKLITDQKSRTD